MVILGAIGGGRVGLDNISDISKEEQANNFTCLNGGVFFNASAIFGLIGPKRFFSGSTLYNVLQYFWLGGALLKILVYTGARMWPCSELPFFSAPIFFGGMGELPPPTPLSYLS